MNKLTIGQSYSRKDVHELFGGDSKFTPSAGTWGLQGMIRTPDNPLNWVFFVTYGHKEGDYEFKEGITEDGVLIWQSQPRLGFNSQSIKDLISFDSEKNCIYLFLRSDRKHEYKYFGKLSYLSHDSFLEKPVHFEWQLLSWDSIEGNDAINKEFNFKPINNLNLEKVNQHANLVETEAPATKNKRNSKNRSFSGMVQYEDKYLKEIGSLGERLVLEFEISDLKSKGKIELAKKVEHSSYTIGDGLGYDIKSYYPDGRVKYIEVKSTTQSANADFYISLNEVEFARLHPHNYVIYRVYQLNESNKSKAKFYQIDSATLIRSDIYSMEPVHFKVRLNDRE